MAWLMTAEQLLTHPYTRDLGIFVYMGSWLTPYQNIPSNTVVDNLHIQHG